jgi:hypothetical protein
MKWSRPSLLIVAALALAGVVAGVTGAHIASSQAVVVQAIRVPAAPPVDPDWPTWASIPGADVALTAQQIVYPKGGGTVPSVNIRAVHHNGTLYIRVSWRDATADVPALDMGRFTDAVALEFPARTAVTVPSFCMGQATAGVNIWQWRADAQAGGPDALLTSTYPRAYDADGPPAALADDPVFQPARALGNPVAPVADTPVQNLVARAFGTLSPAAEQRVTGKGVWRNGVWSVVFTRPFAGGADDQAEFAVGKSTSLAVAVWNGSQGDRAGQKNVSQFVTLSVGAAALQPGTSRDWSALWLALVLGGGAILAGFGALVWAVLGGLQGRRA